NWFDTCIPKKTRKQVKSVFNKIMKGKLKPVEYFENTVLTKKGKELSIQWHNGIIKNKNGKIIGTLSSGIDITEKKKVEQKSSENEKNYLNVLERSNEGIIIIQDTKIKYSNLSVSKISGYSLKELIGADFLKFIHPEERKKIKSNYTKRIQGKKIPLSYETIGLHKNGSKVFFELSGGLTLYNGKPADLVFIRDITEKKKTTEKLIVSELKFRRLFEAAQDAILILNFQTGKIEDSNPFIEKLIDYSKKELLGKKLWEISPFKNIIANKKKFFELKKKKYIRYEDLPLETKSGKKKHVEFVSNVYGINGNTVIQCNIRDITERKLAEEKLDESIRRNLAVLQAIPDMFFVLSDKGKYVDFWADKEAPLAISREKIKGKTIAEVGFTPEQTKLVLNTIKKVLKTKKVSTIEYELKTIKGLGFFSARIAPFSEKEVIAIVRDITELKKGLLAISKVSELKQVNKMKTEFLSSVSHELKTPITPIMIQLQLLRLGDLGQLTPSQNESIELIYRNVVRLNKLLSDLLVLNKESFDDLKLNLSLVDLNELIQEVIVILNSQALFKNIVFSVKKQKIPLINVDKNKIIQVLINLMDNAIKFSENNSTVFIDLIEKENSVTVSIKDSGIGIKESDLNLLFAPFTRLEGSFTRRTSGSGLGLSICKKLIELHNGLIWAERKGEGKGTVFYFSLPLKKEKR
ncbi:MAG: PAS domain S-box protein, partial [Candidatus Diapherotrites archaeon]|nr:PAS domain S-box protein [Candidatus Diapherotrites archaeon]